MARGETVLVMGQGPIGMLLMMLAKLAGATVLTSDPMTGAAQCQRSIWRGRGVRSGDR